MSLPTFGQILQYGKAQSRAQNRIFQVLETLQRFMSCDECSYSGANFQICYATPYIKIV